MIEVLRFPPFPSWHLPLPMAETHYDDAYVQALFDRMGPTYDATNLISSLGFCLLWRRRCVEDAGISPGDTVCDMMSGGGECWRYISQQGGAIVSIDFSRVMVERQRQQRDRTGAAVDVRLENALQTSIGSESIDAVVSAFGLKTLSAEALQGFAREIRRILKPGGRISLLEISTADNWCLSPVYRWYIESVIPAIGKLCLGDIECYRMLGRYTKEFGSCHRVASIFADAGFEVRVQSHFFGCATSLVGRRAS